MEVKGGIESRAEEASVLGSRGNKRKGAQKTESKWEEHSFRNRLSHPFDARADSVPGVEQHRWTQLPSPPPAYSSPCTKSSERPLLSLPLDLRATAPHTHPCPGTSGGSPQPSPTSLPHLWPPGRP